MDNAPKPQTILERLQPWQPSIAAILGFSGVILAMLYNGHKDRAIKAEEEFRAAQATAYGIYLDMERIEGKLRGDEYGAYYVQNEMVERKAERFQLCMRNFEVQRESRVEPLDVSVAVRANLGRLPPQIMSRYLAVLSRLDDVKRATSSDPLDQKFNCEQRPIAQVGGARFAFGSAIHAIGQFAHAMAEQYPELFPVVQQRLSKPESVPFDVRMKNDLKITQAREEESKAAMAKAEAEEEAEASQRSQ